MRISDWSSDVCSSDLLGIDRKVEQVDRAGLNAVLRILDEQLRTAGLAGKGAAVVQRDRNGEAGDGDIEGALPRIDGQHRRADLLDDPAPLGGQPAPASAQVAERNCGGRRGSPAALPPPPPVAHPRRPKLYG